MEVEDRLAGGLAVVLDDVDAVAARHLGELLRHQLGDAVGAAEDVVRDLKEIGVVRLGQHEAVALCGRARVEDDAELVVFKKCRGRDLASRQFAEDAV